MKSNAIYAVRLVTHLSRFLLIFVVVQLIQRRKRVVNTMNKTINIQLTEKQLKALLVACEEYGEFRGNAILDESYYEDWDGFSSNDDLFEHFYQAEEQLEKANKGVDEHE